MKTRFSKILGVGLTLALLCSLLLTVAPVSADVSQPTVSLDDETISAETTYSVSFKLGEELPLTVSATPGASSGNTADWSTTEKHSGSDSAKLDYVSSGNAYVEFTPQAGITVSDLAGITANPEWSFWYYLEAGATNGPLLELRFIAPENTDPNGAGHVDITIDYAEWNFTSGAWTKVDITSSSTAFDYGNAIVSGSSWGDANQHTLAAILAAINAESVMETETDTADDWELIRVRAEIGWVGNTRTCYIDDVSIAGRVYDLEETPAPATITITFPAETVVPADTLDDATIQASPGWIGGQWQSATTTGVTFEGDADELTVTATFDDLDEIGEGATVRLEIPGITNSDEPGVYTLEVSTSEETELVESEEYEIAVPDVGVLPGVVELYNPDDILMDADTGDDAIQNMLDDAGEGWTVKIGEGEYAGDINTVEADVTIEGDGDVEDIIVEGTWTIDEAEITIDGLTLDGDGSNNVVVVTVDGIDFTLEDCVLEDAAVALIQDDGSTADNPTTIEDCTFNIEDEIGVDANNDGAGITDCTFTVEEDGEGVGIVIDADITVTDCIFNGGSGVGVQISAGDLAIAAIEGCTFDGLLTALDIDGGTADIFGGTIQNCEDIAIDVDGATLVTIHNNTITGNDEEVILDVADEFAHTVFMMFNTITDNAGDDDGVLVLNNDDTEDVELMVANNWWGDAAGPGDDAFGGEGDIVSEPFLPAPIDNSAIETTVAAATAADFEDDVGVTVESTGGDMAIVGAAQYTENPVAAIDDAIGFWDVFVLPDDEVTTVTIRFYTDVTSDTELWVWGEARGEWQECLDADGEPSYTPNLFSGFIAVDVGAATSPTLDDLGELPFAVVEPPATTEIDKAPEILSPDVGDDTVSLRPVFAWEAVTGADGYYFQLADNAIFVLPLVKLEGDMGRLSGTTYAYVGEELPYSTPYHWRVKAVSGTIGAGDLAESAWTGGVFITMDEPVEPTPPVVIEPTPPAPPAPIIEPIVEVITPPVTEVTPGWIYAIIAVGGVLVIALLVLIVRTRRVA